MADSVGILNFIIAQQQEKIMNKSNGTHVAHSHSTTHSTIRHNSINKSATHRIASDSHTCKVLPPCCCLCCIAVHICRKNKQKEKKKKSENFSATSLCAASRRGDCNNDTSHKLAQGWYALVLSDVCLTRVC